MNDPAGFGPASDPSPPEATAAEIAAAEYYDAVLVPALFAERVPQLLAAARIEPGMRVLDVACGTGAASRELACADNGLRVVGLDISAGMLAVAARGHPHIEWRHGDAQQLPFPEASFDRVLCQFGLMFFPEPIAALREMRRVLVPGGRLAVAVWDDIANNPGLGVLRDILERLAGAKAARALELPFRLGDERRLRQLAEAADLCEFALETRPGEQRYPSLQALIDAEIRGWLPIMGVELDEALIADIRSACLSELGAYMDRGSGGLRMPGSAHLFTSVRGNSAGGPSA